MNEPVPIILTKLQPPLLRKNTLPRERLAALLRRAVELRLTLVCAGMGYGKTTLIASSLVGSGLPIIWYSLSRSDRDIITFFSYLTEAFDRSWPGFAEAVRPSFAPGKNAQANPTAFVAACVNRLAELPTGDFVVVLDDFQLVDQVLEIRHTLDQLIAYAPPGAHFVVATRSAPAIPILPRLRAEGQAQEIGEAELKFRSEEVNPLLEQSLRLRLVEAHAAALAEQTEGWALGLLMAGQTVRAHGQPAGAWQASTLPEMTDDRRVLFEYLSEEVMRQQPPAMVDFLTSSAILSRLEPVLCDQALGRSDSAGHLQRLESHCLFVVRTEDGWLRYHRLFREFLLQQLARDAERMGALHRRAAAYFEERQDLETAIYHWLEAGDNEQAARLIASISESVLQAGRFDTLSFWFGRLSESDFAEYPELWIRWGKMCESRDQWDKALEHYEQAARAYGARGDLLGLSDVLRNKGHILNWRKGNHVEAERLHREALGYVGEAHRRKRAALLASLSRDQLSAGNTTAAQALYREALAIHEAEADRQGQLETLINPGSWLHHATGDFLQALAVLRRAERLAMDLDVPRALAETHNNMSVNLYFLGRYTEALDYAEKALALSRQLGDTHQEAFALMNQAGALEMTCGASYSDLYGQYQHVLHVEQALGDRRFSVATLVYMMVLARHAGNMPEAARRGQQALALVADSGLHWLTGFVMVQYGAAQIWTDPDQAPSTLKDALRLLSDCGDVYHLTACHFWLAVCYHAENDPAHLDHLRECLRLAVGQHFECLFLSEPQAAVPLLVTALERDMWSSYVAPILVRIGTRAAGSLLPLLSHSDEAVRQRAQSVLQELGVEVAVAPVRETAAPRPKPPALPPLTIRGFGNFSVWRGSHLVEEREWGRRKCKRLMKYIALSPGHTLSRDSLVDMLFADAAPSAANANFYRTLYNLRRVLEPMSPHSGANYVTLEGGLLRLAPEAVQSVDVVEFERGVEEGRRLARAGDHAAARESLSAAVHLYVDDLSTDDLYDDWLRPHRERLRELYMRALCTLADLASGAGQYDLATNYLHQAFRRDSTSESLCLRLISTLAMAGQRAQALQYYSVCEQALSELGLTPSSELRGVHRDLLAGSTIASHARV